MSDALQGCHPGTGHLAMSYPFYGVLLHLGSLLNCFLAGLLNAERYRPPDRDVDDWSDAATTGRPWCIPEAGKYWLRLAQLRGSKHQDIFGNHRNERP